MLSFTQPLNEKSIVIYYQGEDFPKVARRDEAVKKLRADKGNAYLNKVLDDNTLIPLTEEEKRNSRKAVNKTTKSKSIFKMSEHKKTNHSDDN